MKAQRYRVYLIATLVIVFGSLAALLVTNTTPKLGLDLEGGTSVILTATGEGVSEDTLDKTVEIIRQRIDALGVAEPEVAIAGSDNILVQLPGVENEQAALRVIGTTAQLSFRQVLQE
ncbi:MAG TPA: protein translocase subunit SecD, partial [Actinomycetota bacterium]|nr:protein translocase subunit SecD [Actinomycetota bacterium]